MMVYYREGFIRYGGVFGGIDCTESERVKVDFGAKVDKAKIEAQRTQYRS